MQESCDDNDQTFTEAPIADGPKPSHRKPVDFEIIRKDFCAHASLGTALKCFFLGFLGLSLSGWDVGSDSVLGVTYTKATNHSHLVSTEDKQYSFYNDTSCTFQGKANCSFCNDDETYVEFVCSEPDYIYAFITIFFIFMPGFPIFNNLVHKKLKTDFPRYMSFLFLPFIVIFSPILILLCKIGSIFNSGEEYKKLTRQIGLYEGLYEAYFQLCLQFFIILSRQDLTPSLPQFGVLISSALSLNLPMVELYNSTLPEVTGPWWKVAGTEVWRVLKMLPLFFCSSLSKILCIAYTFTVLKEYAVIHFLLIAMLLILCAWGDDGEQFGTNLSDGWFYDLLSILTYGQDENSKKRRKYYFWCWTFTLFFTMIPLLLISIYLRKFKVLDVSQSIAMNTLVWITHDISALPLGATMSLLMFIPCMGMHVLVESLTGGGQDLSTFTWRNWYVQAKHSYQKKFLTKLLVWILALLILLLVGIGFYKLVVFLIDKY